MSAQTRGLFNVVSGTVGGTAVLGLAAGTNNIRNYVQIQNTSSANSLQYTLDGSTPVVNGQGNLLLPGGSATYEVCVPVGAINVIGSAAGTTYTINWL